MTEFQIRRAEKKDCPAMLDLIRELAIYEKAPDEVTVDPLHFEDSGFGANPVWWAFVVENQDRKGLFCIEPSHSDRYLFSAPTLIFHSCPIT